MNEPMTVEATIRHLPPRAARMVAIEVLLSDPAALDDDTLDEWINLPNVQLAEKAVDGTHRTDRVRTRWADADAEDFKKTVVHAATPCPAWPLLSKSTIAKP